MLTYDSLSGYVDNSPLAKAFSNSLEDCFRGLSLIENDSDFVVDRPPLYRNEPFPLGTQKCPLLKPVQFQECYPKR